MQKIIRKHVLALVFAAQSIFAAPTVSNIMFLYGSHSSVSVRFSVNQVINAERIRYIPVSQGSCDQGNASATVETFGFTELMANWNSTTTYSIGKLTIDNGTLWAASIKNSNSEPSSTNINWTSGGVTVPVSGLAANTEYEFCPEASSDGGTTWSETGGSNPTGATFTTLPLPAVHPALPIHPATFDTSYPDTTQGTCWSTGDPGYCTIVETVSGNSCPNLASDYYTAITHQLTSGTVIKIPAGSVCNNSMSGTKFSPDLIAFNPSNIANNTITLDNHGLTEGEGIVMGTNVGGAGGGYLPQGPTNITQGYVYFVHVVDANDFQLYQNWQQESGTEASGSNVITVAAVTGWADSPGLSVGEEVVGSGIPAGTTVTAIDVNNKILTLSASATATAGNVTFTFGGPLRDIGPCDEWCTANNSTSYFAPWPRNSLYWVIVRTSTPDSEFAPAATRVNPSWASKMATIEPTGVMYTNFYLSHIRFTGIEWTWPASTELASNPTPHGALIDTDPSVSNMIFDRNWFHGPGGRPDRIWEMLFLEGMDVGIINSYWDNLFYWHASYGWPGKVSQAQSSSQQPTGSSGATTFTIPQTTVYYGAPNPATLASNDVISWTGTPGSSITTPEIAVYFDMNDALQIIAPQGLTVTASAGTITYTTTSGTGSCTQGDPLIPVDSSGNEAAAPLGCAELDTNGLIIAGYPKAGSVNGGPDTEGCQCFIGGDGPGPFDLENNYIRGSGLIVHFDDSGGFRWRGDYLIRRNYFTIPMKYLDDAGNPYAQEAGIPSDGYWYAHRQPLEWKGGEREWIDGNIFDGSFADVNHASPFDVTAHAGGAYGITDMDVTNNTVEHYPIALGTICNVMDNNGANPPFTDTRFRAYNNLSWDINGFVYSTSGANVLGVGAIGGGSVLLSSGGPGEDIAFDHNTFYDYTNGVYGDFWITQPNGIIEGVKITNNVIPYGVGTDGGDWFIQSGGPIDSGSGTCGGNNEVSTNCSFISGVGNPDLVFAGNLIIPSWNAPQYPEGGAQFPISKIESDWPNYYQQNTIMTESGVLNAFAAVGWRSNTFTRSWNAVGDYTGTVPDFHLLSQSLYNYGQTTDGLQEGVNIDELEAAQGKVTLVGANQIAANSANITYVAPDSDSCSVDYSSTDPTLINSFTRVQDAGGNRVRNVTLSGLTAYTAYSYRVNCEVQQPSGQFVTN